MADLTCQQLVELVTAYLDDALDTAGRLRFELHLALCDGCETYVEQFRQTIWLLGTVSLTSISDEATAQLLTAFRDWPDP